MLSQRVAITIHSPYVERLNASRIRLNSNMNNAYSHHE